ncbi:ArsB/NhaD family transporter [Deltaproteobacteria bacterium]|nr:ArsB/NhaD family transporter [Deltaproteobacteria bacterium]
MLTRELSVKRLGSQARHRLMLFILTLATLAITWTMRASASGGSGGFNVVIREGLEDQAVLVGALILLSVYMLIIFELMHRTLAAAVGGLVAVGALVYYMEGSLTLGQTANMIDWDTIGLLLGMMVMVGVLSHTGVFEWFAVRAYKKSGGSVWSLVVILCIVTAVLSAFLDNVTTMLLLTPVTIQLAKVLDLPPVPLLIAEVMFSNIGGAATMIGDPPNIIIGNGMSETALSGGEYDALASQAISFNDFIINLAPGVLMTVIPTFMFLKWMHRDVFSTHRYRDVEELEEKYGIKDASLLKRAGFVLFLVILGFFLHPLLHVPVAWVALIGAVLTLLVTTPHELEEALEKVEWSTLLFFAGLFVLVHSLDLMGVIKWIGEQVVFTISQFEDPGTQLTVAILLLLWVSAIASAFIDNIPYTATMVPVVLVMAQPIANGGELGLELQPLIWALAFGACLGGNGTLIGASANVVTAGMAEEEGYKISFNEFFKTGFPVMILTTAIVTLYCMLVYVWGIAIWKVLIATIIVMGLDIWWELKPGNDRWFPDELVRESE